MIDYKCTASDTETVNSTLTLNYNFNQVTGVNEVYIILDDQLNTQLIADLCSTTSNIAGNAGLASSIAGGVAAIIAQPSIVNQLSGITDDYFIIVSDK